MDMIDEIKGALEIEVDRLAKDSTLARITQMVEQAQAGKSPTQQWTERFMGWGRMWTSPTRSSGWDIDASLEVLRIYARDNDDL